MKSIIKNNKLIAEFMKFEEDADYMELNYSRTSILSKLKVNESLFPILNLEYLSPGEMLFHSSWDWLMPVVIKVVSMDEYYIFRNGYNYLYMEGNPLAVFSTTRKFDVNFDLNSLYSEMVEFIKWYNKNKTEE